MSTNETLAAVKQFIDSNIQAADAVLSPGFPGKLSDFERALLTQARQDIEPAFETVSAALKGKDSALAQLLTLLESLSRINVITSVTETQGHYFKSKASFEAGKRSGAARALEAQETWQPHALKLAQEARAADPGGSQESVVDYILDHWKLPGVKPPKQRALKSFISASIREGTLAQKS